MTYKPILMECPLRCGRALEPSPIILTEGALLRCRRCGQLVSPTDEETFRRRFQPFDEDNPIDRNPSIHLKRLAWIRRHTSLPPSETRLLDVGCNVGTFLEQARLQGFMVTGVEPDGDAVKSAAGSGLEIKCGYLEEMNFEQGSYDIVTLFEVIEHLKAPVGLLQECHRILKPSGLMFVTTGNTRSWTVRILKNEWDYFSLRLGHISFYSPASIRALAEKTHFRVRKIKTRSVSVQNGRCVSLAQRLVRKVIGEAMSLPAKMLDRGHDMFVVLEKEKAW